MSKAHSTGKPRGESSDKERQSSRQIIERVGRLEGNGLRTATLEDLMEGGIALVLERAEGSWLFNAEGDRFLDLSGLYAVAAIGHNHPRVVEAIQRQAARLIHCPSAFPSSVRADFLEALESILPNDLDAIIPAVTGAMANEIAVGMAAVRRPGAPFIAFGGGYLGRSYGVVGLAGKVGYRQSLGIEAAAQFLPYPTVYSEGADAVDITMQALYHLSSSAGGIGEPAAVILEPIQGNGGVVIPPAGFLHRLREFCDRTGALLIVDEIQSGCGRTGKMWAVEYEKITPDIMTIGKAIGGGMAVAAVAASSSVNHFKADSYSSTFLTNSVNLAASVAAVSVIRDDDLASRSARLGAESLQILQNNLQNLSYVADIRGRGLWCAIEFRAAQGLKPAVRAKRIARRLFDSGVLVGIGGYHGEVVKIAPPLNIDEKDLRFGLDNLVDAIRSAA